MSSGICSLGAVSAIALASTLVAQPVLAQSAQPAEAAPEFADIIVTARKVEERQQSLPIAISAFSSTDIKNRVVINVQDLQTATPGLTASINPQGAAPIFAIRGTATENLIDGGVALYFGDMPVLSSYTLANNFFDVASVEILKGPQGTQFGTNTTGGTISVRPKAPTDSFEGYVTAGYGKFERRELEAAINIPLSEAVKFRFAGNYVKRDGFVQNPAGGAASNNLTPSSFWDENRYALRGSVRVEVGNIVNDLIVDYYNQDQGDNPQIPIAFADATGIPGSNPANFGARLGGRGLVFIGADPAVAAVNNPALQREYYLRAEIWGVQDVLRVDLSDNWSIRNVIGWRNDDVDSSQNNSGTSLSIISVQTHDQNTRFANDFTLQYVGAGGRLRAALGGYYQRDRRRQGVVANAAQNIFRAFGAPNFVVSNNIVLSARTFRSKAIYANVDYDVTEKLTLTGGLRYNWDSYGLVFQSASGNGLPYVGQPLLPTAGIPCSAGALASYAGANGSSDLASCTGLRDGSSAAASYNAVATYKFSDRALAYAKISHGYLSGGLNTNLREVPRFAPEKNTTYEIGGKADWQLGGRPVRTNIALFYSKISNKQVVNNYAYDDFTSGNGVFNAARETVYGFELDGRYSPVEGLNLDVGYSYVNAKFDKFLFPAAGGNGLGGGTNLIPATDLSGNTPALTPTGQLNLAASYELPVSEDVGKITATLSGYHTSSIIGSNIDRTRGLGAQFNEIPAYWLANVAVVWENVLNSPVSAQFWMKNVFNKNYLTFVNAQFPSFGYTVAKFGEPQTYGVAATIRF